MVCVGKHPLGAQPGLLLYNKDGNSHGEQKVMEVCQYHVLSKFWHYRVKKVSPSENIQCKSLVSRGLQKLQTVLDSFKWF